eukprot:scaffold251167_cov19-Tisochrysis_lutea.AAC.1
MAHSPFLMSPFQASQVQQQPSGSQLTRLSSMTRPEPPLTPLAQRLRIDVPEVSEPELSEEEEEDDDSEHFGPAKYLTTARVFELGA